MRQRKSWLGTTAVLVLAGCTAQQQATVENTAEQAGNTMERAGNQVANTARPAIKEAKEDLSDSGITLKVKTALSASDKVDASGIDIDTENRVVYLKGVVPDAGQKTVAESLAKNTVAAGVKVVNQLQVRPAAKSAPFPTSAPAGKGTPSAKSTPGSSAKGY